MANIKNKPEAQSGQVEPNMADPSASKPTTTGEADQTTVAAAAETLKKGISSTSISVSPNSETVTTKEAGAVQGNNVLRFNPAGAADENAVDDRSRNTRVNTPNRPQSRNDKNAFISRIPLMNVGCEQSRTDISHDQVLSQGSLQGKNSKIIPFQTYSNKRNGNKPQNQFFFRSIDFERLPMEAIAMDGQNVRTNRDDERYYPAINRFVSDTHTIDEEPCNITDRGNFLLTGMNVRVNNRDEIVGVDFEMTDLGSRARNGVTAEINHNLTIKDNLAYQQELKLIKSGLIDENSSSYNGLASSWQNQRKRTIAWFGDMEATTGAIVSACYRFANMAYAFENNRLAKSGSFGSAPDGIDFLLNPRLALTQKTHDNIVANLEYYRDLFNHNCNDEILPMLPIFRYANPSIRQFTDYATLIQNARSPKNLIDAAENFMEAFYVNPKAWAYIKNTQLFSTFDGKYSPTNPITYTKGYGLVLPQNLNDYAASFSRSAVTSTNPSGTGRVISSAWGDERDQYEVRYKHTFVDGILKFLMRNEDKFVSAYGGFAGLQQRIVPGGTDAIPLDANGNAVIHYDCLMYSDRLNPFCFLVLAALRDMTQVRNIYSAETDPIWAEIGKPTDRLVQTSAKYALAAANFTIVDYAHPLQVGAMSDVAKFRYLYPERFVPVGYDYLWNTSGSNYQRVVSKIELPWYFSERSMAGSGVDSARFGVLNDHEEYRNTMNYPMIRAGLHHEYTDLFSKFDSRTMRLSLDRIADLHYETAPEEVFSKRYDPRSSGRVVFQYEHTISGSWNRQNHPEVSPAYGIRWVDYLTSPRELGFYLGYLPDMQRYVYVGGLHHITGAGHNEYSVHFNQVAYPLADALNFHVEHGDDYVVADTAWAQLGVASLCTGETLVLYHNDAANNEAALQRAAGYQQNFGLFVVAPLSHGIATMNADTEDEFNVCFSAEHFVNGAHATTGLYELETYNEIPVGEDSQNVDTCANYFYTMFNLMMRPYNVYQYLNVDLSNENTFLGANANVWQHDNPRYDMFETSFYYGLCGFDCSMFYDDINQRDNNYADLQDAYLEDEYIKLSPVLQ